jgi:cytochrome b subunit of formate dehydrogenase
MATDRKLTYWMLTATLVLAYVAGVVMLQAAFYVVTGQESQLAVVVSTLVSAFLLNSPRKRIQGSIDRWSRQRDLGRSDPA